MSRHEDEPDVLAGLEAAAETDHYDPEVIADVVMWPVLDKLCGYDWRQEAELNYHFELPRREDFGGGEVIDVILFADCMPYDKDEDNDALADASLINEVSLEVQRHADQKQIDYLVSEVMRKDPMKVASLPLDSLNAVSVMEYHFQEDGVCRLQHKLLLQNAEGATVWQPGEDDPDTERLGEELRRFRERDLDEIGLGLAILTCSPDYAETLEAMKHRPIQTY